MLYIAQMADPESKPFKPACSQAMQGIIRGFKHQAFPNIWFPLLRLKKFPPLDVLQHKPNHLDHRVGRPSQSKWPHFPASILHV